jgi:hypothetical protein
MKKMLAILLILTFLVVGCQKTIVPEVSESEEVSVENIGTDISEIDSLEEELSLEELESLENDLDNLI